jgi:hypothetical protein
MPEQPYLPMQIGQILDKTTVVVIGPGVEGLKINDDIQILAVGKEIPNLAVPLIVPKAALKVQSTAGAYVVARTSTYDVEIDPGAPWRSVFDTGKRTETRRHQLTVDEGQMVGNPSNTPVAVGDPVIKPGDLARFIAFLRSQEGIRAVAEFLKGKTP